MWHNYLLQCPFLWRNIFLLQFLKCPDALYSHFLFAVTEKSTCQSKWGECSLTSENSLFKLLGWPRAEYSKCLNTEWGIYEKRGYVVLHSKEALHSLERESGNVDLYAQEYTHKCAHTYVHMHTHPETEKHRHNTPHSFSPLSHIPSQLGGCYLK